MQCERSTSARSSCCHHYYSNLTMFVSMQLGPASRLRKVFSYETHFGEVSGMSSQCSKLNLVSYGKSTNLRKQFFSSWHYVRPTACQRRLPNASGILSWIFLNGIKALGGRKCFCPRVTHLSSFKNSAWSIAAFLYILFNNMEHSGGEKKSDPLTKRRGPLCARSDFWVQQSESEKEQHQWLSVTSCNAKRPGSCETPQHADLTKTPDQPAAHARLFVSC